MTITDASLVPVTVNPHSIIVIENPVESAADVPLHLQLLSLWIDAQL